MLVVNDFEIDQEMLEEFLEDCFAVMASCTASLENFSRDGDPKNFEDFGQAVDRIMGAALTLGFSTLGNLAKLGKEIGYKSSQIQDMGKLLTLQSILAQISKEMDRLLNKIKVLDTTDTEESQQLIDKCRSVNADLGNLRASVKF